MKKYLIFLIFSVFSILGIFLYQYFSFNDGKMHVIFCNVGQGDGVLIKDAQGEYFMQDGGPDEKILSCMERHMPFWKRKVQIAFLSHPHSDHFVGYLSVLKRYAVSEFVHENLVNHTAVYKSLENFLKKNNIQARLGIVGDVYKTKSGMEFKIIGPSQEFIESTSPRGYIGESEGFANLIIVLKYKNFEILFTGDSQVEGLTEALGYIRNNSIELLLVPHHGSRFGLSESLMADIDPKVAVISVGKNNYGHPSREILQLLKNQKIPYFRTDKYGDIEIVSDGERFWVQAQY